MSKFKKSQQPNSASFMRRVVGSVYPTHHPILYGKPRSNDAEPPLLVTEDEILTIAKRLRNNKAPGIDGIPNRALKEAKTIKPRLFAKMYNACIIEKILPDPWKIQRLVLLSKPKQPPDEPSSYRPLCMPDTIGKLYESIVRNRLELGV